MKELWVVRHAKSSWKDPYLDDFDRPLNKRGKRDAPYMSEMIASLDPGIEYIITSPAKRALQTAQHFREALELDMDNFILEERLYHSSVSTIMYLVHAIPEQISKAMIFGHNPGFTMFINSICNRSLMNLPTCGVACIQSDAEFWSTFEAGYCEFAAYYYPKMYF